MYWLRKKLKKWMCNALVLGIGISGMCAGPKKEKIHLRITKNTENQTVILRVNPPIVKKPPRPLISRSASSKTTDDSHRKQHDQLMAWWRGHPLTEAIIFQATDSNGILTTVTTRGYIARENPRAQLIRQLREERAQQLTAEQLAEENPEADSYGTEDTNSMDGSQWGDVGSPATEENASDASSGASSSTSPSRYFCSETLCFSRDDL